MKIKILIALCLVLLIAVLYCNWKFEVVAINPCYGNEEHELKVMTWNVHCSNGAAIERQKEIAEQILKVDADFVLLNEYNQDSCRVLDSLLKNMYPFCEDTISHKKCGDIFYSKRELNKSGRFTIGNLKRFQLALGGERIPDSLHGKPVSILVTTISCGHDSVRIYGVHFVNNRCYELTSPEGWVSLKETKTYFSRYSKAQEDRNFQSHWIKEAIKEENHPVIVMGDMNDFSFSAPLDTFSSCGLKNAWWEGGNGFGHTFHTGVLRLRIDHILHSEKIKLQSIKVIDTNLSDHNPIVAGFSINN